MLVFDPLTQFYFTSNVFFKVSFLNFVLSFSSFRILCCFIQKNAFICIKDIEILCQDLYTILPSYLYCHVNISLQTYFTFAMWPWGSAHLATRTSVRFRAWTYSVFLKPILIIEEGEKTLTNLLIFQVFFLETHDKHWILFVCHYLGVFTKIMT